MGCEEGSGLGRLPENIIALKLPHSSRKLSSDSQITLVDYIWLGVMAVWMANRCELFVCVALEARVYGQKKRGQTQVTCLPVCVCMWERERRREGGREREREREREKEGGREREKEGGRERERACVFSSEYGNTIKWLRTQEKKHLNDVSVSRWMSVNLWN